MPLLPKETDIFSDDLFSLSYGSRPWSVAHVRSRQEKMLARHLLQHRIPFYLPLTENAKTRGGRIFRSYLPLFPGYVFYRAEPRQHDLVWRANVATDLLDVPDQQQLGEELEQIRRLQLAGASFRLEPQLVSGDRVRITDGVFAGYTGIVVREKGRTRLLLQVSLLRQAVSVEVERETVAKSP